MKKRMRFENTDPRRDGIKGRGRSQDKDGSGELHELRAKGHTHPRSERHSELERDPKETEQNRGKQKGFGNNQRQEGEARHAPQGTHSSGAERANRPGDPGWR